MISETLEIPNYYNIDDFNIVDLCGLNDSDDNNDVFFSVLKNNISKADIIFYVTDASRAFVNKSEVTLIENINDMILNERKENLHHIDVAIIVNKYDDFEDDDLSDIYKRIPEKVKDIQTFRVSSHKLLINNLIKNKLNLIFPVFLTKEVRKILQNSSVNITNEIKTSMKNNFIKYSDVIFGYETDNMPINCVIQGDWDDLIGFISICQKNNYNERNKIIKDKLNEYFVDVTNLYENMYSILNNDIKCIDFFDSIQKKICNELNNILLYCTHNKNKNIDQNDLSSISKLFEDYDMFKDFFESYTEPKNGDMLIKCIDKIKNDNNNNNEYTSEHILKKLLIKEMNYSNLLIKCIDKIKNENIDINVFSDNIINGIDILLMLINKNKMICGKYIKIRLLTLEILMKMNVSNKLNEHLFSKLIDSNEIHIITKIEIFIMKQKNDILSKMQSDNSRLLSKILSDENTHSKIKYYLYYESKIIIKEISFIEYILNDNSIDNDLKKVIKISHINIDKLKILLIMGKINLQKIYKLYDDSRREIYEKEHNLLIYGMHKWVNHIKNNEVLYKNLNNLLFDDSLMNNARDDDITQYLIDL